jgi:long-chain acyl-CoA synthetase
MKELADFLHEPLLPVKAERRHGEEEEVKKDIDLPKVVGDIGRAAIDTAQRIFYDSYLDAEILGQVNVPVHTNFIVAPNHQSHLDTGLVKKALGDAGKNMAALAASDYFFDTRLKRTFFDNFTNLIPMERQGSMHESLKLALQALHQGYNLLIFPEGTRSKSGKMADFKFSLGYLALRSRRGILPMRLSGTFEAMPKGKNIPKRGKVTAVVGPFLPHEDLEKFTAGMQKNAAYRLITLVVQKIVEQLEHGPQPLPDLAAVREQWNREHQLKIEEPASAVGD